MLRLAEDYLKTWIGLKDRKPSIIRGARQVGKTTLVKDFCKKNNLDLILVNSEKITLSAASSDNFKIEDLVAEIEAKFKKPIHKKTLLFFDEIQAQSILLERLRYFFEEKSDLLVIAAGSLLDLYLDKDKTSFPVGRVSFFNLGPMTFCEYLIATGNDKMAKTILNNDFKEFLHQDLLNELKKYMFIGGMPEAIKTFAETHSLLNAREIQRNLVQTTIADFHKYEKRVNVQRLERVFQLVGSHLGNKLIYQHIDRDSKSIEIKKCIELFIKARLLTPAYHCGAKQIPLEASIDYSIQKLYHLDIGMVNYIHNLDWDTLSQELQNSFSTKGYLAEQFIAQHLAYRHQGLREPNLLYWLRDKSTQKAEIDFLLERKSKIIPIEVKSQRGGHLKSLIQFSKDHKIYHGIKFSTEFRGIEKIPISPRASLEVKCYPLYAVEGFLREE